MTCYYMYCIFLTVFSRLIFSELDSKAIMVYSNNFLTDATKCAMIFIVEFILL